MITAAALGWGDAVPKMPMAADLANSAEAGWLKKKVLDSRLLDEAADPKTWVFRGQGAITFPAAQAGDIRHLHVEVNLREQRQDGALPAVNVRRPFAGEDWSGFNRISVWIRPQVSGFPMLPLVMVMHNEGAERVPDVYNREGNHYLMLPGGKWTQVVWEIAPLARDKVTSLEFSPWVNKRLPDPGDRIGFDIGRLELQRVEADHFEGWQPRRGTLAYSHTGYDTAAEKTAIASDPAVREFQVVRAGDGQPVLTKAARQVKTRLGTFQELDFSEVRTAGEYRIRAGGAESRPFRIAPGVWDSTIWKTINFFFTERCGFAIPGIHGVCHRDWLATLGDRRIAMNGGWHDAGDLSQGLINTGEATYAMFALAAQPGVPEELRRRLLEEARWGLDWLLKVRFEGGYRIGFASNNIWTNGIVGDGDDRTRAAQNNPNVNFIAAAAEARAYRVLKASDPELARRALKVAEDDWRYAIAGKETPENLSTPAFASSEMELASIGILASVELFHATGGEAYARKSQELAAVVLNSQQRTYVGHEFPLAGFFYTSPAKTDIFHQFHRGNDQAPVVAMAALCDAFPQHADWMKWYSAAVLYSEYQKAAAAATEPYGVLPAYVYRDDEYARMDPILARYRATPEVYREQVLKGMPMGGGYYLKAFPVWFERRGNYGLLLSQAKGLSAAARLRGDRGAEELARKQLQWVVGRNPFAQSTMWGEGYDFAQQYSLSSGDLVGSLPVGMMTRGNRDEPYWPSQNCYVYKEVWVHPSARWLWLMEDLALPASPDRGAVDMRLSREGDAGIRLTVTGSGRHRFTVRTENVMLDEPEKEVRLQPGTPGMLVWRGSVADSNSPWVAVVVADGDIARRREIVGALRSAPR